MKIILSAQTSKAIDQTPEGFRYVNEIQLSAVELPAPEDGGPRGPRVLVLLHAGDSLIDLDPKELLAAVETLAKLYGQPAALEALHGVLRKFLGGSR